MLSLWQAELSARPAHEATTAQGKRNMRDYKDTESDLMPLFENLFHEKVDGTVLNHLRIIVDRCEEREYVVAASEYIKLTIGNATWPIGVTQVGIHARANRGRLEDGKIKHLMKDEEARRYLTSFKRLMTRCQALNPTVPSKMFG